MTIVEDNTFRIEAFDGSEFWCVKKNKIYKKKDLNIKDEEVHIKISYRYAKSFFTFIDKCFRTGIHQILPTETGCLVVVKRNILVYKGKVLDHVINIPRGSRPLRNGICIINNFLYFADYWRNPKKELSNVYKVDLLTYKQECILELPVRHIHFIIPWKNSEDVIIGTGDDNEDTYMFLYNLKTKEKKMIGEQEQKYRAVSLIKDKSSIIWGSDNPDGKNYIYRYDFTSAQINCLKEVSGPVYYTAQTSSSKMYLGTTIEDKKEHKAILYSSSDGFQWKEERTFYLKKRHNKYFGYGVIQFITGQEQVSDLKVNLMNLSQ